MERKSYLLVCRLCGDGDLVMPFASPAERGKWAADHTRGAGHDKWWVADSPEQMAHVLAAAAAADTTVEDELALAIGVMLAVGLSPNRIAHTLIATGWRNPMLPYLEEMPATRE